MSNHVIVNIVNVEANILNTRIFKYEIVDEGLDIIEYIELRNNTMPSNFGGEMCLDDEYTWEKTQKYFDNGDIVKIVGKHPLSGKTGKIMRYDGDKFYNVAIEDYVFTLSKEFLSK